jgi:ribosomal-protein-alanine N-acetyltransferase
MKITLARHDDAERLAELSRTLIEHGLPWSWNEGRIASQIRHPECAVIVARDGRRLAGFASMQYLDRHAHLTLLAVRPGYRQRGIGRALVDWLEACARTAGVFEVRLELRISNAAALAFYERLGYIEDGIRKGYYAGREDARRMVHDLSIAPFSAA